MSNSSSDSRDLHPKPNLVDSSTVNRAINDTDNKHNFTTEGFRSGVTDDKTDMMWQYLANEDKLVNTSERKYFGNDEKDSESTDTESTDTESSTASNTTDVLKKNNINISNIPTQKPVFNMGTSGSSGNGHINGHTNSTAHPDPPKLSKEQIQLEKLDMLRKLGELAQKGVTLSQKYTINSDLDAMRFEYELHNSIRAKQNSINWMSNVMMNCVYGIEMLNDKYDPFSVNLTGWSQHMNRDINNYYDVFGELYEKYNKPGKSVPPEIKLLLMITGSATKFAIQNTISGSLPNIGDKFKEDPELAATLRARAQADKMKQMDEQQRDGLQNYMNQQHDNALKQMNDIHMLEQKKKEFMMKQELLRKQEEINRLQKEIGSNMSLSESDKPSIKPVQFPPGMMSNPPAISPQQLQAEAAQRAQMEQLQQLRQMQQMQQMQQPQGGDINEMIRQQSIIEQKRALHQQEMNRDNVSLGKTHVSINPHLRELMMNSEKSYDTDSKISSISTENGDNVSKNSKVILRRKRKKNHIKINT